MWYIGFRFTLELVCLNKADCSVSVRFHFDILGLCQDIEKFGQREITFILKPRIMLCPLKHSYVLGVLSQRRFKNHKRPVIKKHRGKALPKPRRKMSLFCIATCHRAEAKTADKYTKVVKLQTYYSALYRKYHKFTQQVSNRARNTRQVF